MADTSERKTIQINPELFKVSGNTLAKPLPALVKENADGDTSTGIPVKS